MKLRNFLYLNSKVVNDYVSAVDGYVYEEESQSIAKTSENSIEGKINAAVVKGDGLHTGKREEEIKRSVKISEAAKFEKIYKYLQSDNEDGLKYYEEISEDIFAKLQRDDFLEVLVTARFSKMKALTDGVLKVAELATAFESLTDQQLIDKETNDMINGLVTLRQLNSGKEIACVFEFDDDKYPIVAYLDESYFKCGQENFVGQSYLLCKVIRKIPKGKNIKLDEIFDSIKKLPLNRAQRRSMPKDMDNPAEIRDVIKGPALVVLPIAVYQ